MSILRVSKKTPLSIVSLMFVTFLAGLILLGCGGSGGGGGDGIVTTDAKAIDFTVWPNGIYATEVAMATISLFPGFTEIGREVLILLENANPNNSPFELTICTNAPDGSATLTWSDNDNNLVLSTGDIASLNLNNCDLVTGNIESVFNNVDVSNLPRIINIGVTMNFTIPDLGGLINVLASYEVNNLTLDDVNYKNTFTALDAPGQVISFSQNAETLFQFGCFNVMQSFSIATPDTYDLVTSGVVNMANEIMSLADGSPLTFINDLPYLGTQRLLSQSVPNCAAVGVSSGVNDSNGAYVDIEAQQVTNGDILIKVFDINDNLTFESSMNWDAL